MPAPQLEHARPASGGDYAIDRRIHHRPFTGLYGGLVKSCVVGGRPVEVIHRPPER